MMTAMSEGAALEMEAFVTTRTKAAEQSQDISRLERERTALRHRLTKELMAAPTSLAKTAAADSARLTDEYQDASEKIEGAIFVWEKLFTEAEGHRMHFQLLTLDMQRDYDNMNTAAELQRIQAHITGRIRELDKS